MPETRYIIVDTTYVANGQMSGHLPTLLRSLDHAGIKVIIPTTVYRELAEGWPVARAELDTHLATSGQSNIEIWDAARYGATDYPIDLPLPDNAGDNSTGEVHRYLEREGYHRGQIEIHADDKFRTEIPNPDARGNIPLVRAEDGHRIVPVNSSTALGNALEEGRINPADVPAISEGYQAMNKPGVSDQAWPGTESHTRVSADGTPERIRLPTGQAPPGEGWVSETQARAMGPDVAAAQAEAAAWARSETSAIRSDPASYDAEGRFTPEAGARWTAAQRAVGALGVGLGIWDSYSTGGRIAELLNQGDTEGARQEAAGLLGRLFGGLYGAEIGLSTFGFFGMVVGGIAGVIVGDTAMREIVEALTRFVRGILYDPLVVDLDGDGVELVALAGSATHFDLDDDGVAERTGWVAPQDGLLVHDGNANGVVDGVGELFGSGGIDGYDDLKTLDLNNDGRIDAADPAFAELVVWRDINSDGVSTPDELLTLAQAGITRFNLAYTQTNVDVDGNLIARTGSYTRADGSTRGMASVQFALDQSTGRPVIPPGADISELLTLPNLAGSATIPDLRTAMYFDPVLKAMVEQLVHADHDFSTFVDFAGGGPDFDGPPSSFQGLFLDILYRWTGVDTSLPQDPEHPWSWQVFEALTGMAIEPPTDLARERLDDLWAQLVKQIGVLFLFQAAQLPQLQPMLDLGPAIAALDPDSPTFLETVESMVVAAQTASATAAPAYEYLELFTGLTFDPATGAISGDFDAFVADFLENQPSFFTTAVGGFGGGSPNGDGLTMSGSEFDARHPWTAWYEDQGSLLFAIATAMGIESDYVLTTTGWRWITGEMTRHHGTTGNDLLDFTVTYYQPDMVVVGGGAGGPGSMIIPAPRETRDQLLFGYEGNDELRGNDGVDRLVGGTGNDLLKGGSGSDMYVYAVGDGLDRIIDASGAADAIYFSREFDSANLRVAKVAGTNDLKLHFGDASAGIVLTDQWSSSPAGVEHFHFVGQSGLTADDIASLYLASLATAAADTITGSWANERLIGLAGDDALSGADGHDTLEGGIGNDTLSGGNGSDILLGGDGTDTLYGGNDSDRLLGGLGNDRLEGNSGSDSYTYARGDGDDTIFDYLGSRDNVLVFSAGIVPANVLFSRGADESQVKISFAGFSGSILLQNQWWHNAGIEKILFADGTEWTEAEIAARYVDAQQTGGNDTVWGSNLADVAEGGAGNDTIRTFLGADTLIGGLGNDRLEGAEDADTYVYNAGDGDDVIYDYLGSRDNRLQFGSGIDPQHVVFSRGSGVDDIRISFTSGPGSIVVLSQWWHNAGIESVSFVGGTVWDEMEIASRYVSAQKTAGSDTIWGSNLSDSAEGAAGDDVLRTFLGGDTLTGGPGNDRLEGAEDADTYVYNVGDGDDVIYDYRGSRDNKLVFGTGIAPADIVFSRGANDQQMKIGFAGQAGSITVDAQWWWDAGIESILFADGTVWNEANFSARYVTAQMTAGNDTIWGTNLADAAVGGAGDDVIRTQQGTDTLSGGLGNDRLEGAEDRDTYIYNAGDGYDVIYDYRGSRDNKLVFGAGISSADILVSRPSADATSLRITFKSMPGGITIERQTWGDAGVELFQFADGSIWTEAQILALLIPSTEGNDILPGTAAADTIWALEGADTVRGQAGPDFLHGQDGNDRLEGGEGADALYGGSGDDVLVGDDRYLYGPNLLVNGSFETKGTVVGTYWWGVVNSSLPGWTKTNSQHYELGPSGVEGVGASDGSYWLDLDAGGGAGSNMDISQSVSGLAAGALVTLRFDHANRTTAASGSFEVYWNGVIVTTISSTGTVMQPKSFHLVAAGGNDTVSFRGTGTADNAGASLDNVRLSTRSAAAQSNDVLVGGDGADTLEGGGGADLLTGGAGADLFRFQDGDSGLGSASDRILDFVSGEDRIDLSALDAHTAVVGDQAFVYVGEAAFSASAGELRQRSDGTDTVIEADVDGDGVADLEILLSGALQLTASDFLL